eukprot:scaffold86458_cov60-Phaeocystis_antarctica.AAC.3
MLNVRPRADPPRRGAARARSDAVGTSLVRRQTSCQTGFRDRARLLPNGGRRRRALSTQSARLLASDLKGYGFTGGELRHSRHKRVQPHRQLRLCRGSG